MFSRQHLQEILSTVRRFCRTPAVLSRCTAVPHRSHVRAWPPSGLAQELQLSEVNGAE